LGARLEIEQLAAGHAGWCGAMIGIMGPAVGAGAVAAAPLVVARGAWWPVPGWSGCWGRRPG